MPHASQYSAACATGPAQYGHEYGERPVVPGRDVFQAASEFMEPLAEPCLQARTQSFNVSLSARDTQHGAPPSYSNIAASHAALSMTSHAPRTTCEVVPLNATGNYVAPQTSFTSHVPVRKSHYSNGKERSLRAVSNTTAANTVMSLGNSNATARNVTSLGSKPRAENWILINSYFFPCVCRAGDECFIPYCMASSYLTFTDVRHAVLITPSERRLMLELLPTCFMTSDATVDDRLVSLTSLRRVDPFLRVDRLPSLTRRDTSSASVTQPLNTVSGRPTSLRETRASVSSSRDAPLITRQPNVCGRVLETPVSVASAQKPFDQQPQTIETGLHRLRIQNTTDISY